MANPKSGPDYLLFMENTFFFLSILHTPKMFSRIPEVRVSQVEEHWSKELVRKE
jgi:hypothetical protein